MLMSTQDFFICLSCFLPERILAVFLTDCHETLSRQPIYVPLITELAGVILHWSCILTECTSKFKLCRPVSNSESHLDSTENVQSLPSEHHF